MASSWFCDNSLSGFSGDRQNNRKEEKKDRI